MFSHCIMSCVTSAGQLLSQSAARHGLTIPVKGNFCCFNRHNGKIKMALACEHFESQNRFYLCQWCLPILSRFKTKPLALLNLSCKYNPIRILRLYFFNILHIFLCTFILVFVWLILRTA